MMHAVGQPNSFFLQFLSKARPRTQFDEPWISNLEAAKQTSIRPYAVGQLRIPTMPSGHTELKASTYSDLMPSTVLR